MLATLLVVFVLQAISVNSENPYVVDEPTGKKVVTIPFPKEYTKLKLDNVDYARLGDKCTGPTPPETSGRAAPTLDCTYNTEDKIATVNIEKVEDHAWVGFEMYEVGGDVTAAGYQTVYFSQNKQWTQVKKKGCILPEHSSTGLIVTEAGATSHTINCARMTTCPPTPEASKAAADDTTLTISVEGTIKCEKAAGEGTVKSTPACKPMATPPANVEIYEFIVEKPADASPKTNVYCGTATSQMSYVIEWTPGAPPPETTAPETTAPETTAPETTAPETTAPETTAPETTAPPTPPGETPAIVDQATGEYEVSIPVPNKYETLKLDNVNYDRVGDKCTGPTPPETSGRAAPTLKCTYDEKEKIATVNIAEVEKTAWVGFEMYKVGGDVTAAGYQTVYFSQNKQWTEVKKKGCIQPQHSSKGLIPTEAGATSQTIQCARLKTCPPAAGTKAADDKLIISVEGTKKCEKGGEGEAACKHVENENKELEIYEFNVEKPDDAPPRTYVYCGTDTSQMSYVIEWTSGVSRLAYVIAPVWALVAMMWM